MEDMPTPTGRELEILKVLWEHGPCSVRDVHRELQVLGEPAYNTVQTLLRIMEEKKGLVKHHVTGRTFVYSARFSRDETTTSYAATVLERVFDGAAAELVQSLLRTERVTSAELHRMETMIVDARRRRM